MNTRLHRIISHPATTLTMLLGLIAALAASPASAQGTAAQQAACQGDAMRLCGAYIPDVARISACMSRQVANLSAACRAQFHGGGRRHHAGRRTYSHRRSHHYHQ